MEYPITDVYYNVSGVLSSDENPLEFKEVDLYNPTEDWMRLQLDYTRYGEGDDPVYGRRFGVGGIEFRQITPEQMDVYLISMDADATEEFLFTWNDKDDKTPYDSDGDIEMSAEFAYTLCVAIEECESFSH